MKKAKKLQATSYKLKRIGIDARFFGPKDKGFGRYTQQLVENLERLDKKNQYFIFLRKDSWQEYQPESSNFKKVLADYKWYGWKEQILLSIKLKKYKLDLVHFTHFNVPIFYRDKFVVTIHDLTLRHFSTLKKNLRNFLFYPLKKIMYKLVFGRAVKKAEKVIAISNYTKRDILKYCKISPEKIEVIYEGAPVLKTSNFEPRIPNRKYLLYVGNAYPHKNLERLIGAFKKIKKDFPNLQLVLAGGDDYFYRRLKKHLNQTKRSTKRSDQPNEAINQGIIFPGFVKEEDLDTLYQNAILYVFPSLCEGFGLPSLEAMARGLPVVSSNSTCLPEILGDAVIYFDPLDINDMAEKIKKTLSDDGVRKKLIEKGFELIKKYSWEKMARETLALYKK